ncbi:MAG TPA: hypothetical protein VIJ68_03875, partial [Candidatus Saccharimonadales bacterium]
ARRMTPGASNHVRHIAYLQWVTNDGTLHWSSRADMVDRVNRSRPGTFFVIGGGSTAALYVVTRNGSSWVQTESDETKLDNLLYLPIK